MEQSSLTAEGGRPGGSVGDSLARSKEAIGNAANDAMNAAASDTEQLRNDLKSLKDTITAFMGQAGAEAAKSARDVSAALKAQGAGMTVGASERGKSLIDDIETMVRRNPLGALAGALVVGMLIAGWGRRR